MKITSPIFGTMSGKLGGAVASKARGGVQYLRKLSIPSNPRSQYQTTIRLILTAIAAAWRSDLTGTQRSAWEGISPGQSSGIDSYVKANTNILLAGETRVDDAPASLALATDPLALTSVTAATRVVLLDTAASVDIQFNVFVSRPQNASRLARQHPYTFAGTVPAAGTSVVIPVGHPAAGLVAGDIVYVRVVQYGVSGGGFEAQVAPAQEFRAIVV